MKPVQHRNSIIVLVLVVIIAVFVFSMYLIPSDEFQKSKVYYEPAANFSIQVPYSFNIQREKISEDEAIIKIVAPNDVTSANPGLVNIVVYKSAYGRTLEEQAAAFLSINQQDLIPFSFKVPAYSYLSQIAQEQSYYYFMENSGYIIVFKFNYTYFDKNNPLIMINNSLYANTVIKTLNSINFKKI
jgi:hypothetical protein